MAVNLFTGLCYSCVSTSTFPLFDSRDSVSNSLDKLSNGGLVVVEAGRDPF